MKTTHRFDVGLRAALCAAVCLPLLLVSAGAGATIDWIGADGGSWNNAANWSVVSGTDADSLPDSSDTAEFPAVGSAINVDFTGAGNTTVDGLVFNSAVGGYVINGLATSNWLTLDGGAAIDVDVQAGHHTINGTTGDTGELRVTPPSGATQVWNVAADSSLSVNAGINRNSGSSNSGIDKTGDGMLAFGAGSNSSLSLNAGTGWTVSGGVLRFGGLLNNRGNSGNNVTVASGASLQLYNGGTYNNFQDQGNGPTMTNANNGTLTLNGDGFAGLGSLRILAADNSMFPGTTGGNVVLATDASIGVDAGLSFRLAHPMSSSGTGSLTKLGAGTLVFDADNSNAAYQYAGDIVVAEGTMLVNTQAVASSHSGDLVDGFFFVSSTDGLSVGRPVSGPGIAPGTYIHSILGANVNSATNAAQETMDRVILSQDATTNGAGVSLDFGGVASALHTSSVAVSSGATLGGIGSIVGSSVTIDGGGMLAPGASIGTFTLGSASLAGTLAIEYDGSGGMIDLLLVDGSLDVSGGSVDFLGANDLDGVSTYVFASYGSWNGEQFASELNVPDGYYVAYGWNGDSFALAPVPEPSTMALAAVGFVGLLGFRRRNRKS